MSSISGTEADALTIFRTSRFWNHLERLGARSRVILLALLVESGFDGDPEDTISEAKDLVECFEEADKSNTNRETRSRCRKILRKTVSVFGIIPRSYHLNGVTLSTGGPHSFDTFSDIWEGERGGERMCVKAFRGQRDLDKLKRRIYCEILRWRSIRHPNIAPYLGISETLPASPLCLISPWLRGPDIRTVKGDPLASQLLAQAACGLEYLHSKNIVHGGVYPKNILIGEDGVARLVDFGIEGVTTDPNVVERGHSRLDNQSGVCFYLAPEAIDPEKFGLPVNVLIKESDVWSFAMTAYEVLTGMRPYGKFEARAAKRITSGDRPPHVPLIISDRAWTMIQACWMEQPEDRLEIRDGTPPDRIKNLRPTDTPRRF